MEVLGKNKIEINFTFINAREFNFLIFSLLFILIDLFSPTAGGAEFDMRYVYCAASVCYMLNDWSTFNIEKATEYIISSQGYDSGIGQV